MGDETRRSDLRSLKATWIAKGEFKLSRLGGFAPLRFQFDRQVTKMRGAQRGFEI
jgi:hypothetical protein